MSRGRALRSGVAFDERTGFKVKGRKLRWDGERNILTTDPDPVHPQRYVRTPGPDGNYGYQIGPAESARHVTRIDLSDAAMNDGSVGNPKNLTLRRNASPFVICHNGPMMIDPLIATGWSQMGWGSGGWGVGGI